MKRLKFEVALDALSDKLTELYRQQGSARMEVAKAAIQQDINDVREAMSLLKKAQENA